MICGIHLKAISQELILNFIHDRDAFGEIILL